VPADTGRNMPPRPLAALAALGRMAGANLVGRVISAPDGVRDANDAFLRIAGYSRRELEEGRVHWRALSPPEWTGLDDDAVAELKAYGSYGPHLKEYVRRDGTRLTVEVAGAVLSDEPLTWVTFVRDTALLPAAELLTGSGERLAALATDLARDITVSEVARTLTGHVRRSLGASGAVILDVLPDGQAMRRVLTDGIAEPAATDYAEFATTLDAPATRAWRRRELIFYPGPEAFDEAFPHLAGVRAGGGVSALLATPLISGGQVTGVLTAYWAAPHVLHATERAFITSLAGSAAQALARAQLLDAERAARVRLQALQAVTAGLATAVTSDQIAAILADEGLSLVAGHGVVAILDDAGEVLRTRTTPGFPADIGRKFAEIPVRDADHTPVGWTVRTGQTLMLASLDEIAARFPRAAHTHEATGTSSVLNIPVRAGGRTIGALAFGFADEGAPGDDLVSVAETLAELAGQALERARLYEAEYAAARQLQQALLPRLPAELPGAGIGASYRPANQSQEVGGDWYDVFELPGGRIGCAAGDVVGHDLAAAAAMGRLQLLLRYAARGGAQPAAVLAALDQACPDLSGTDFATVVYAEYDPAGSTLTYACAGHPPPLLADGDAVTYLDGGRSAALGVGEPHGQATVTVQPGARLVLYTDGLIERRAEPIDAGFDRLAQAARRSRDRDIGAWCQSLLTALTQGEILADDVALACIELRGLP
jgi:PAS domain S-box-containing protein